VVPCKQGPNDDSHDLVVCVVLSVLVCGIDQGLQQIVPVLWPLLPPLLDNSSEELRDRFPCFVSGTVLGDGGVRHQGGEWGEPFV